GDALRRARTLASEHKVPVVVEIILERVTNIAMGNDIDAINEFEELVDGPDAAPTALLSPS
ncbi:hypothetical protein CH293_11825, partial [Rhodococcus sp. 14-2470-1b]